MDQALNKVGLGYEYQLEKVQDFSPGCLALIDDDQIRMISFPISPIALPHDTQFDGSDDACYATTTDLREPGTGGKPVSISIDLITIFFHVSIW